jgi:SAM-dependent methyltransferase
VNVCSTWHAGLASSPAGPRTRWAPAGRVAGLDLSPEMIEVAASLPAQPGCAPEWRQGDAGTLPYQDAAFDVVLCQMGLMFFPDRAAALSEMRRVLVPGGRVVLGTPGTIPAPFMVLDAALARHISPALGGFVKAVFSLDDPGSSANMIRAAGFEEVGTRTWRAPLWLPPAEEFLWQYVASTPLRAMVNGAPPDARAALEAEVVGQWRKWVADGHLVVDLPLVLTYGRVGGGHAG